MDSTIGRIPHDPTTPTPPVKPVGRREPEDAEGDGSAFEEELEEHGEKGAARPAPRPHPRRDRSEGPAPPADPDVGGNLDLTV